MPGARRTHCLACKIKRRTQAEHRYAEFTPAHPAQSQSPADYPPADFLPRSGLAQYLFATHNLKSVNGPTLHRTGCIARRPLRWSLLALGANRTPTQRNGGLKLWTRITSNAGGLTVAASIMRWNSGRRSSVAERQARHSQRQFPNRGRRNSPSPGGADPGWKDRYRLAVPSRPADREPREPPLPW